VSPLSDSSYGVVLFNRGTRDAEIAVDFTRDLRITGEVRVRDLVAHRDEEPVIDRFIYVWNYLYLMLIFLNGCMEIFMFVYSYSRVIPAHGTVTLRVTPL
jgi:hypothetical protein